VSPRERSLAIGAGGCALALALLFVDPRAALGGWLAAAVWLTAVPTGALGLLMMMKLIPGPWREELMPWTERLLLLLPLAALGLLPVLLGVGRLYPWSEMPLHGYRAVYLSVWTFEARSILFLAVAIGLALALVLRPSEALASAGLVGFVLFDTTVVVDWLMSLEPEFHSSGFGLYGLSIQFTIAVAVLLLLRLAAGDAGGRTGVLGALMLAALLAWAYLAFMQYFILWSGNLPQGVKWYRARGEGGWSIVEYVLTVSQLAPLFLLFFPPIRKGRPWLLMLCLVVLLGKALEIAWLVLPTVAGVGVATATMVLAMIGLGGLALRVLQMPRRREAVP
jgi:hypothetical protein